MELNLDTLDRTLGKILDTMPIDTIFKGKTKRANRTSIRRELQERDRNFIDEYGFTLIYQASQFDAGEEPQRGEEITLEGVDYLVIVSERSVDGVGWRCHMASENTGSLL